NERRGLLQSLGSKQLEISGARSTQRESLVGKLNDFQTERFSIGVDFKSGGDHTEMLEYFSSKGCLSKLDVQHLARKWPELLSPKLNAWEVAEKIWTQEVGALVLASDIEGQRRAISQDEAADLISKRQPINQHDGAAVP